MIAPQHLHVESVGAGPPLVLLHGFAMHGGLFAHLLPSLARRHRVHVVDLPGHGHSPPVARFDLASLAGAVDDATAGVGDPLAVLGWSLGGQVALQWALDRPDRMRQLVLVSTSPSFVSRDDWRHAMDPAVLARFGDELRVAYRMTLQRFLALQMHGSDQGPDQRRAILARLHMQLFARGEPSQRTLGDAIALLGESDLRPLLPRVRAPALVIGGDRDTLVPLAATVALSSALTSATHMTHVTHVTIAGAAHAPFLSHPAAFTAALDAFFQPAKGHFVATQDAAHG